MPKKIDTHVQIVQWHLKI